MKELSIEEIKEIASSFNIPGELQTLHPFKLGHINETYVSIWQNGEQRRRFIHQLINNAVFRDVPGLMNNVCRVTLHIQDRVRDGECLTLVPHRNGSFSCTDKHGNYWRTYHYIEGTECFEVCRSADMAFESGRIAGQFLRFLDDLPPPALVETIPGFLFTPGRYRKLHDAIKADRADRASEVSAEIHFAAQREEFGGTIASRLGGTGLRLRAAHNDLKLNNILFSQSTGKACCIVDLDTCMPGSVLYDFGDLVRSVGVTTREDETELEKITLDMEFFAALSRGFLSQAGSICSAQEVELMPLAPRILALTLGVRFLTDFLEGDTYFKVHHPLHNLDRARAQFRIVSEMERLEGAMRAAVSAAC